MVAGNANAASLPCISVLLCLKITARREDSTPCGADIPVCLSSFRTRHAKGTRTFLVPPGGGWPVGPGGVCPRTELERPCSEVWGCDEAIHPPPLRGFPPRRGDLTLRDSRLLGCGHAAPGIPWFKSFPSSWVWPSASPATLRVPFYPEKARASTSRLVFAAANGTFSLSPCT